MNYSSAIIDKSYDYLQIYLDVYKVENVTIGDIRIVRRKKYISIFNGYCEVFNGLKEGNKIADGFYTDDFFDALKAINDYFSKANKALPA